MLKELALTWSYDLGVRDCYGDFWLPIESLSEFLDEWLR